MANPFKCLLLIAAFACPSALVSAAEVPNELTDSSDRATFRWLLERVNAEPEVHYKNGRVEWIAFKDYPLESMRLAGCPFDGDGLRAVAQIKTLKTLDIFHTAVTDDDIAALRAHPNLEEVFVGPMWDDRITNQTVEHLSHISKIKRFRIVETYLSDDGGLEHLTKLGDQIALIDLGNTVVPLADLERLKKELPDTTIEHQPVAEIGKLIIGNWKGVDRKLRKWTPAEVIDAYIAAANSQSSWITVVGLNYWTRRTCCPPVKSCRDSG